MAKADHAQTENDRGRYAALIDTEIWAFVARTESFYPPDTIDMPMERQRAVYADLCRVFYAGRPASVGATDVVAQRSDRSVPVRRYRCAGERGQAAILYFHGGGFVLGNLDSHGDIWKARTGARRHSH